MRSFVLLAIAMALPGTALAGTILTVDSADTGAGSIITFAASAPEVAARPKPAAETPAIAPGQELVRITHADGKTKIYRTSAWLGGSPVTYVTAATPEDLAALKSQGIDVASSKPQMLQAPTMIAASDPSSNDLRGVDTHETTGAVPEGSASETVRPIDVKSLRLRQNLGVK